MKSFKWAIRRHLGNYKEINKHFSALNNKKYSANGRWVDKQDYQHHHDFLIFPCIYKSTFVVREIPVGYKEVTWDWFCQNILKKKAKQIHYEIY